MCSTSRAGRCGIDAAWLSDSERVVYSDVFTRKAAVLNTLTGERTPMPEIGERGVIMSAPGEGQLHVMEAQVDGDVWMLTLEGE